jgi:hypothetical protein
MADPGIGLALQAESGDAAAPIDLGLAGLIDDFKAAVRAAVDLMAQSGIARPATTFDWVFDPIKQSGALEGGVRYFKHGHGCKVALPGGTVDFDFGAQGEIDQFDCRRLAYFAKGRLPRYRFADERALEEAYRAALDSGAIKHAATRYNAAAGA